MDAIETAIRNAFDKGDPLDPDYRQRVYRSAIAAVEKALQSNQGLAPEAAAERRENVRAAIGRVESEFALAQAGDSDMAAAVSPERSHARVVDIAPPAVEGETRGGGYHAAPSIEPDFSRRNSAADDHVGGVDEPRIRQPRASRGKGRWLTGLLATAVVIALAAGAVWWAASSGLFGAGEAENQVEAPADAPPLAEPAGQASGPLLPSTEVQRDWITVFSPADATSVTPPTNASAELMEDDSGRFIRIRSSEGAPVSFELGQGILERIAGARAVFNIIARAEEGKPTEMAIECDFGGLGDCGRKRYAVNYQRGDFLFEVELPEGDPTAGSIAITADVDNAGKAVDVYEIRVAVD